MTLKCSCGGRFLRTDIIAIRDPRSGRILYTDTDNAKANWRCDRCGAVRTQRKRQPTKGVTQ